MRRMKLTVVGCSPAWPNPGGAQSGYLIEGEGRLLLDCGPGVLARLRERDGWPRVDSVVITHFHLDHWGDLVPWAFGARFGPGRETPQAELWLPPGGLETVRAFETTLGAGAILDVFAVHEYQDETPFRTAGFEITPRRMAHYEQLTFGMRVANGTRTLAYSGDSGPSPALAELARDADLFVCEATLAAHRASGAKRLLVVHRPDELPLSEGVERAHDGDEVTV
jgi:ribonuclease BN (tRNA processing enzyme)